MLKPDFSIWSPDLPDNDLAAALAAAGILMHRLQLYPFLDSEDELADELRKTITEKAGIVRWDEPTFLTENFAQHTSSQSLLNAWKTAMTSTADVPRYWLRLEAEMRNYPFISWYASHLMKVPNIRTFYVHIPPISSSLDWLWPLHIGFLPDEQGSIYRNHFENWLADHDWAQGIVNLVDSQAAESTLDILITPEAEAILSGLKSSRRAIRANCLLSFGRGDVGLASYAEHIARYRTLTQAMGFVFVDLEGDRTGSSISFFDQWMDLFLRSVSHDTPFDEAIKDTSYYMTQNSSKAIFFGSQFFIRVASPSARVDLLADELLQNPDQEFDVTKRTRKYLHLREKKQPAAKLSKRLRQYKHEFGWQGETREATSVSQLTTAVRQMEAPPSKDLIPPGPARFLQQQLVEETFHEPVDLLTAGHSYQLSVHIGPLIEHWMPLEAPFPEDQLPKTGGSYLLTVILAEPNHLPEPLISTLDLPPSGPSNICEFQFTVSKEHNFFEGRLLVLYENRILQTAILRSPVWRDQERRPEGRLEFKTEGIIHPITLDLKGRTCYDAAFVFNHSHDGQMNATAVTGLNSVMIKMAGVKENIENIMALFNASDWEKKKAFDRPDSADTLTLLCDLALHGSILYDVLVTDMPTPEVLLNAKHIQAVMASEDYHFPVEFIYPRPAPKSTAQLCSHGLEQLKEFERKKIIDEPLGVDCMDACTTKDRPRDFICPLAFWGLSRVIEWHQILPENLNTIKDGDYMLSCEPTRRKGRLEPLKQVLMGVSEKIDPEDVDRFLRFAGDKLKLQPVQATSWDDWESNIQVNNPNTLLLMVHSDIKKNLPSMEINGKFPDPPNIDKSRVGARPPPPLVLLLGCGTRHAAVPTQSLAAQFRRGGAAIVVSTIAELLDTHAPRLAQAILAEMAKPSEKERSFGEVLLTIKRQGLLHGLPIALALVAYGDADWWI